MKFLYLLGLVVGILSIDACKRTCENVKVGETELAANTVQFLKYSDGDELEFTSVDGKTTTFKVSTTSSEYFICQKVTCDPIDPYKSSFCEYIEAPLESIFLNSDSTLIAIEASVFAYEPKTDLLYDAVRFTISHVNTTAFASHITDVKFDDPSFDRSEIIDIDDFMDERSEVNLREKTFKDVLICEDDNLTLYFSKEEGIIGYKLRNELYTLAE